MEFRQDSRAVAGPLRQFSSPKDATDQIVARLPDYRGDYGILLRFVAQHMDRFLWFQLHRAHGMPQLIHRGRTSGPFGESLLVECSQCAEKDPGFSYLGARQYTFPEVIPEWFGLGEP